MTRTARSTHPRAMLKDRSESRTGLDKSLKKGGAGAHSWGDLLEDPSIYPADDDGVPEEREAPNPSDSGSPAARPRPVPAKTTVDAISFPPRNNARARAASVSVSYTEEDIARAKQFRTRVFSSGAIDLAAIARTSAAVANPANLSPTMLKSAKSFSSVHSSTSDEH